MCGAYGPSLLSKGFRLIVLGAFLLSLDGCAGVKTVQERPAPPPPTQQTRIERNQFTVPPGEDVIGSLAVLRIEKGDTIPDVARHFSLGISAVSAANPGLDLWVPEPGKRVTLPLSFVLPDAPRKGIVINLATMRLFHFKGERNSLVVSSYPIGIGTSERPTPTGQMRVERKATRPTWHVPASIAEDHRKKGDPLPAEVPPGPENPLGECALYLSKAGYLIHGTNKPASIGLQATNGCMRLYPENMQTLYDETPLDTPVVIVSQPYLVGRRGGVLYLEAHTPAEGTGALEREKVIARLKKIERRSGRSVDWKKVKQVLVEARGVPVPILASAAAGGKEAEKVTEVEHPARLWGQPEIPELKLDAWYVLAADTREELAAVKIAGIINHQGPPIPARVLSKNGSHRVVAGPFADLGEAREALRRLKIDLELEGILIGPIDRI